MAKPDPTAPTVKVPEQELAETEAWGDFDKLDLAEAAKAAADPGIDATPVTKAFENVSDGGDDPPAAKDPKPAATEAPTGSAPAIAAETKPPANPLFADLPEDVRGKVQEAWERENAALLGRVAPVQRQNAQLLRENQALKGGGRPATPAAPKQIAMPGDAGWDKFKKDYPEIALPMEARLNQFIGAASSHVAETVETRVKPVADRVNATVQETALEREARRLAAKHPDFVEVRDSKEWDAWLSTLPAQVRLLEDSTSADDADYMLTQFKGSTFYKPAASADPPPANGSKQPGANGAHSNNRTDPALDARRQRQLDGARTPASRGGQSPAAAVTVIPEDEEGAWKAFERLGM